MTGVEVGGLIVFGLCLLGAGLLLLWGAWRRRRDEDGEYDEDDLVERGSA